jgi:transitional endoplasmic reticulum ATPase
MATTPLTQDEKTRKSVMDALSDLGHLTVGEDTLIFDGTKMILPKSMEGPGSHDVAIRFLLSDKEQQSQSFTFTKIFNFRPWDGANAFQLAMKRVFGTTGVGASIETMFGEIKPEYRTVNIGANETIQVPWNRIDFSPLEASFILCGTRSREYGEVFAIQVEAPRKYRKHIEAFFQIVEDELKTNSIYRGKAFTGGAEPIFLDTKATDPTKVIYSADVQTQLDTNMWSLIRYSDAMRENKISLKRAVLVEGPYGTGKTLAGMLTAREAVENGWTFILARPGQDDLQEVLKTAQLYAPAVVWYEDIDVIAEGKSEMDISRLLDSLDGITNKGTEILAGFTTNHVDKIQKGVLRPGRLDAIVHIDGLDAAGFEKLIKVTLGDLLGEVDYIKVAEAFDGMLPAFAKEAIDRAVRYSISRNKGKSDKIDTSDLVNAANGLRPQLDLMKDAKEGVSRSTIEQNLIQVVTEVVDGAKFVDGDGDSHYSIKVKDESAPTRN